MPAVSPPALPLSPPIAETPRPQARTVTAPLPRLGPGLETHPWRWPAAVRLPLLTLGSGWLLVLPPCLPQPRRHRAGRPLLPERLPPANPAAILQRPLRRFRRGATALPHTAPTRSRSRTDLAAPLPPPPPPAPPPSLLPPPPSSSHAPRPPLRARSGFRLSPSARRGPHVSPPPLPARGRSRCYFLPRRAGEQRDRSEAILKPGARCGSAKATRPRAGRLCPDQRCPPG